jgi:hypothetical protein
MIGFVSSLGDRRLKIILVLCGLKFFCTLLALFVFTQFSPLVDAEQYLLGTYRQHDSLRTLLIQKLTLLLSIFGGPLFVHLFFGMISLAGMFYYFWRGGARWQLCVFLLLPSTLIWTSVIGKEAIFYGAFTLCLAIWAQFIHRKCMPVDFLLLFMALVLCLTLRPHYGVAIVWLFMSAILLDRLKSWAWVCLCLLACLSITLLFVLFWDRLLEYGFYAIDPNARASRFTLFGIDQLSGEGFGIYKALLPLGAILGIVGPMPSELFARPLFVPFFLEGMLVLISPVLIYVYTFRRSFPGQGRFNVIFWGCLAPAILGLIVAHAPFGLLNPGSATRWRVNFEAAFHMAPMLLFFSFIDNKCDENNSLSS